MVRRHGEDQGLGVVPNRDQRRRADCRRRVAALSLQDDARALGSDPAKLLRDDETVLGVGDDRQRLESPLVQHAARRLLQHGLRTSERQKLLWISLAG